MKRFLPMVLMGLFASGTVFANSTPHDLSASDFSQDWSNIALITSNDDWTGVPSIQGFNGNGLTSSNNVDPRTVLDADDTGVIDVIANQSNPNISNGGVAEFDGIANPVVAYQGSGSADAPYLKIYLNTTGRQDINVKYNLRDVDGSADDSVQQVALHFRVGNSGSWTDVPAAYVADASSIGNTLVTPIDVTLPAAADNTAEVQIRIMTTNASGSDEFIGVDDIEISSDPAASPVVASAVVDNHVSVNGGSDGQATASASGGTPPYNYIWNNGATTPTITGVFAGTYSVTVTDSNGAYDSDSVTITEPAALVVSAVVDNHASANGVADGQATASASGGNPGYTYLWSNGQTNAVATGLFAATYTVTVTDTSGGNDTASVVITEPTAVVATAVVDNNASANGVADGQATASASGGNPGYTYLWSNGQTNAVATGLFAATYTVTVTDTTGGNDTASVVITEPTAVVASAVIDNNISVNGGADGQATASASGGVPGYTYAWSDGQITATATGLSAATYTVTVTDINGASDSASVTLTEPTALLATVTSVTDESHPGAADGSATVAASGGVAPYTYLWSNGGTTATITGLTAGTYDVTVTDNNGATASPSVSVVVVALGPIPQVPVNSIWMLLTLISLMLVVFIRQQRIK